MWNINNGGEGGIRTHVGQNPQPISSRCRYGHFGTSPKLADYSIDRCQDRAIRLMSTHLAGVGPALDGP